MKLWVDDVRFPPWPYTWSRTYSEAIRQLERGIVTDISLDHDLGSDKTGYDIACWIEEQVELNNIQAPNITCHSSNPVGRQRIEQVADRLKGK